MKNYILGKEKLHPIWTCQAGTLVCCQCPGLREAPGVFGVCCKAEPAAPEGQCWDACTALSLKLLSLVVPFHELSLQLQLWKSVVRFLTQLAPKMMVITVPLHILLRVGVSWCLGGLWKAHHLLLHLIFLWKKLCPGHLLGPWRGVGMAMSWCCQGTTRTLNVTSLVWSWCWQMLCRLPDGKQHT